MGKLRFMARVSALCLAGFFLAQCDFNIFPDFLTRVTYTKNLGEVVSANSADFSLSVVNVSSIEYVMIVQYLSSGNRKLYIFDKSLNVLAEHESAGLGRATGFVFASGRPALVCGVILIDIPTLTASAAPVNIAPRDYFFYPENANVYYYDDHGGEAADHLDRYSGTVAYDDDPPVWTAPALSTNSEDIYIGNTAGRSFTLDAIRANESGYITAIFRESTGRPFLVYNTVSVFKAFSTIPDTALYPVPGFIGSGGSWVVQWNQALLMRTDGRLVRYRPEGAGWVKEDEFGSRPDPNFVIAYGDEFMYAFNPNTREMMRVVPEWRGYGP